MQQDKKIPLIKAVLMGVNIMVGAGLLAGPGAIARAGIGNLGFLSWVLAGVILFPVVFSVAKLASLIPVQGGIYAYCSKGFGRTFGFYAGWLYYLCYIIACAGLITAYRDYITTTFPSMVLLHNPYLFLAVLLFFVALLNVIELSKIATVQSYLTAVKLSPIIIGILLTPFFLKSSYPISMSEISAFPKSLTFAIFGFFGFEFASNFSDKIEGGAKASRMAVMLSFLSAVVLCTLFHFGVLSIMGFENLATYLAPGYPLFVVQKFYYLGYFLIFAVPASTVLTYFNSSNGILFLATTIIHALSSEKQIRGYSLWNKLNCSGRPVNLIALTSLLILATGSLVTDVGLLFSCCNMAITGIFIFAMITLYKVDPDRSAFTRVITITSIVVLVALLGYHWHSAGATFMQKIRTLTPLFVGLLVGPLVHSRDDQEGVIHREPMNLEKAVQVQEALEDDSEVEEENKE